MDFEALKDDAKERIVKPVWEARKAVGRFSGLFHHYTTADGLQGILTSGCLRFTRTDFLNDFSEIQHGIDLFTARLQEASGGRLFTEFQDHCKRLNWMDLQNRNRAFVCCFSTEGDNLDMWRGYGSNSPGYSIGFRDCVLASNTAPKAELLRVIYGEEEQVDLLDALVGQIRQYLEAVEYADDQKGQVFNAILFNVWLFFPILKHGGFRSEKEYRLVVRDVSSKRDAEIGESITVKTYSRRNYFVPCIELDFTTNKGTESDLYPIESITIGPCAEPVLAEKGLKVFLGEHRLGQVDVKRSQIPFRG